MKKQIAVQPMTVQDVSEGKGPLFLLNTTYKVMAGGGDVFITVKVGDSSRTLKVPHSWVPFEATAQMPRSALVESTYLLEAVSNGLVTPISKEDAERMKQQPGYQDEVRRLNQVENTIREASKAKGIGRNVTVTSGEQPDEEVAVPNQKKVSVVSLAGDDEVDSEATVSASFQAWVSKTNLMEDYSQVRNEVRLRGELTEAEAYFMMENTSHEKLRDALRRSLQN